MKEEEKRKRPIMLRKRNYNRLQKEYTRLKIHHIRDHVLPILEYMMDEDIDYFFPDLNINKLIDKVAAEFDGFVKDIK